MDLNTLKNMDINTLKNLDLAQIKAKLLSRVDILINIFLIAITIFATIYIYNNRKQKHNGLLQALAQAQEKKDVVDVYRQKLEELDELTAELPESLNSDLLISKISEFALLNDVQIKSFSPAQETVGKLSTVSNVKINISAKEYKNLLAFTNQIEQSDYFLKIKSWSGRMDTGSTRVSRRRGEYEQPIENDTIEATIEIESLSLNKL